MRIFIIVQSLWFISEIALNRLFRSDQGDQKDRDKGSIRIIWITIGLAVSLGVVLSRFFIMPISRHMTVPYVGLFLILTGMAIRFYAIWTLGRFFTVDVTIRDQHIIIKKGLYRTIRHPSYLGSLVSFVGFGLSLNNWMSLGIIVISVSLAMLHRMKVEEEALIDQFGSDYLEYKRGTYRLLPFIY